MPIESMVWSFCMLCFARLLPRYFGKETYYPQLVDLFIEVTRQTELGQLLDLTSQVRPCCLWVFQCAFPCDEVPANPFLSRSAFFLCVFKWMINDFFTSYDMYISKYLYTHNLWLASAIIWIYGFSLCMELNPFQINLLKSIACSKSVALSTWHDLLWSATHPSWNTRLPFTGAFKFVVSFLVVLEHTLISPSFLYP